MSMDDDQPLYSISPPTVSIDRSGESAMRRAARFRRKVPGCDLALRQSLKIQFWQAALRDYMREITAHLIGGSLEALVAPADPLPCGLLRWQGRVLVDEEIPLGGDPMQGSFVRVHSEQLHANAHEFRVAVEEIVRLFRARSVATRKRGSLDITGGGEDYD